MSRLLREEEVRQAVASENGFIKRGHKGCVEGIKYDFRFSGRFLKAKHGRALSVSDFSAEQLEGARVEPGETVFVLTEEILELPADIKAELSHKRKLAHEGVLVLGGFCIDPLYSGPLIFGMHNFSADPWPLEAGRKLIAAQFYQLSSEEVAKAPKKPEAIKPDEFPADIVARIGRFEGVSYQAMERRVEELSTLFRSLRDDFDRREDWFKQTETFIGSLGQQIKSLTDNLTRETEERKVGHTDLAKIFKDHEKIFSDHEKKLSDHERRDEKQEWKLSVIWWIVAAAVCGGIGWLTNVFTK